MVASPIPSDGVKGQFLSANLAREAQLPLRRPGASPYLVGAILAVAQEAST